MSHRFSITRFLAIITKEFIQMRRDRVTFGMMVGIPMLQLLLFGYAINSDPKDLPAAVLMNDNGPQARTLLGAIRNSSYYKFVKQLHSEDEAREVLEHGEVQFVITIPQDFSRDLLRGDKPSLLVEADATDPAATSNAIGTVRTLINSALQNDLKGPLAWLAETDVPVDLRVHALYNPEAITQYNIVPGLMGVVLTMTMVMITALAITRERERGTMENLLSMPTRPFEVFLGKIIPYMLVGYIQVVLILVAAHFLFHVPMVGNLGLLFAAAFVFIAANLAVGITFSTVSTNQLQAVQGSFFFFLPSLLLSGFMFPFRGMPQWAQNIGEVLPLTHFLRIVRGVLLKGNTFTDISLELWHISMFAIVALIIGVLRYRQTLD
ncbi:MAG: ABC transporter permease [Prosthecobacter sp.]